MELQTFKNKFVKSIYRLEEQLAIIRERLFGEGEENEPEEDWSQYTWIGFTEYAIKHLKTIENYADRIYEFIVSPECCDCEQEDSRNDSEFIKTLQIFDRHISNIEYDINHTYNTLTGDVLERTENKNSRENANGYTAFLVEELDVLIEDVEEVIKFITGSKDDKKAHVTK